jgi:hypothetical protein
MRCGPNPIRDEHEDEDEEDHRFTVTGLTVVALFLPKMPRETQCTIKPDGSTHDADDHRFATVVIFLRGDAELVAYVLSLPSL